MSNWTKEPWNVMPSGVVIVSGPIGKLSIIASCDSESSLGIQSELEQDANAARIVDCVNACAGIANPAAIKDAVAALKSLLPIAENGVSWASDENAVKKVHAALAALRKEQQ
jgi:hypothetical protein